LILGLTLLLVCQLAGEVIARLAHLPIPGPVVGMGLLFCGLVIKGDVPPALEKTGGNLLTYLALLFVPAGVGIMRHLDLILSAWLPISAALFVSTILTVIVTGITLLNRMKVHDPHARGLAMGVAAHGLGTARALQESETAGAYSGLAMGLNGLISTLLLPLLASLFR
jgi:holin-like protein